MRKKLTILLSASVLLPMTVALADDQLPLAVAITATAQIQQDTTEVGDTYNTPAPSVFKIDNKAILQRLSEDLAMTFPVGAKLALLTDSGGFVVLDKLGDFVADVSSILRFEEEETYVESGKGNHATGARANTSRFIGKVVFNDGGVSFSFRGLVTATETAGPVKESTPGYFTQTIAVKGALKNGTGNGNAEGSDAVITGAMTASAKGVVPQ